jgi:outer membrane protein OmpA-like peptidoglycan-associated protein
VRGYADRRGGDAHNRALSERRARRVIEWLSAHGVAAERLQLDPQGASELVEQGDSEGEHQQNRRVVFRVLRTEDP